MSDTPTFAEWAILELLGHRRLAGYLTEQEVAGRGFLRLDVPGDKVCERCCGEASPTRAGAEVPCPACHGFGTELTATQLYSPGAVYCITPTTENIARQIARGNRPAPVQRWELEPPRADNETIDDAAF